MFQVDVWHQREVWRKGDLESEYVKEDSIVFKTRRMAKEYILSQIPADKKSWQEWHRGEKVSRAGYYTGHSWVHENTGETIEEYYSYELFKYVIRKS